MVEEVKKREQIVCLQGHRNIAYKCRKVEPQITLMITVYTHIPKKRKPDLPNPKPTLNTYIFEGFGPDFSLENWQ